MKWIEYDYVCNSNLGIVLQKKVEYNEVNLAIAEVEAYNGEYTIVEDEESVETFPLGIELGGTGATNVNDAFNNLVSDGAVTASKVADGAVSTTYTATIPASGWADNGSYASQTIVVSGLLATDTVIVDIVIQTLTLANKIAVNEAWGNVFYVAAKSDSLEVYATEPLTIDVPLKVLVIRK